MKLVLKVKFSCIPTKKIYTKTMDTNPVDYKICEIFTLGDGQVEKG